MGLWSRCAPQSDGWGLDVDEPLNNPLFRWREGRMGGGHVDGLFEGDAIHGTLC